VLTNNKYIDYKAQTPKWAQRKWDILLEVKAMAVFNRNDGYSCDLKDSISVGGYYTYPNSEKLYKANIGVALNKNWSILLGVSRLYTYSGIYIRFNKPPIELGLDNTGYVSQQLWFDYQWTLEGAYNRAITKRWFLQSKLGLVLFLHDTNVQPRYFANKSELHFNQFKTLHAQTYGFNGEVGVEFRLLKPLSIVTALGYIYNFNDAIYQRRGTIDKGQTNNYFFTKNFTIRVPTLNVGLKYNLGCFYNGDKSNWLW
jgi:hypothetical protein